MSTACKSVCYILRCSCSKAQNEQNGVKHSDSYTLWCWGQLAQFCLSIAIFTYSQMRKSAVEPLLTNNAFFYYCFCTLAISFGVHFIISVANYFPRMHDDDDKKAPEDDTCWRACWRAVTKCNIWMRGLTWLYAITCSIGKVSIIAMSSLFLNLQNESGTAAFSCGAAAIGLTTAILIAETMYKNYAYKTAEGFDMFKLKYPNVDNRFFHTPSFCAKYQRFAKSEDELLSLLATDENSIQSQYGLDIDDLVRGPPSYATQIDVRRYKDAAAAAIEALTNATWRSESP